MKLIAGCDGGGTKCHVKICLCEDDGTILQTAEAITGSANVRSNPDLALQNILQAIDVAKDKLNATVSTIDTIVLGLAGAGTETIQQHWQTLLAKELSAAQVTVVPDALLLFASHQDKAAVATIIGTGSIAFARDTQGNITRAGGLGPAKGDEGSAFWIGSQAIHHARTSKTSSPLTMLVEEFTSKKTSDLTNDEIARLAPAVFDLAGSSKEAKHITDSAASHIADLIATAAQPLPTSETTPLDWICTGGVALGHPKFLGTIQNLAATQSVHLNPPILIATPVDGAIEMALSTKR